MKTIKMLCPTIAICAILAMPSCGQGNKKRTSESGSEKTTDTLADRHSPIIVDLSSGYADIGIHKDSMQNINIAFDSPGEEVLYGHLILPADGTGNVRFSQITMPNGDTDGPFGRDISYDLTAKGTYTLSLGESLMQGDPYDGNFIVELHSGAKIPYEEPSGYFVRNDVDPTQAESLKINSQEEFENIFGMAATMSSRPSSIDFSRQFAIAVIGAPTDINTQYEVTDLIGKANIITLVYRTITGKKQSYTIRPFLLLTVDKKYDGDIRVIEQSSNTLAANE
jgi:hypothetical protein